MFILFFNCFGIDLWWVWHWFWLYFRTPLAMDSDCFIVFCGWFLASKIYWFWLKRHPKAKDGTTFVFNFGILFPKGVLGRPLAHFGTLLAPFLLFLQLFQLHFASQILPLDTRICKAPAEQPQTHHRKNSTPQFHLTRATCGTLPQALRLINI